MRRLLVPLAALAALLAAASPARAGEILDRAAEALRSDPVYVDPQARPTLTAAQADRLRESIDTTGAEPTYIAVLPAAAVREAGGEPAQVALELGRTLRREGTYATVAGGRFRAASSVLGGGEAARLATEAFRDSRQRGLAATLEDFVARVGEAQSGERSFGGGGGAPDTGGGVPTGLLVLLGVGAGGVGLVALSRSHRRRREREQQVAELREAAEDDLVALGDDVRSIDLDVEMPDADPRAREALGRGLAAYERAERLLGSATQPQDFGRITETIAGGRQAMAEARAYLDGREPPEPRPPCFFDPRHGPSVTEVEWAPDGAAPRPVPVCAADAARLADGRDPQTREVRVGGATMPYWQAPGYFAPWAGGYYGGGRGGGVFPPPPPPPPAPRRPPPPPPGRGGAAGVGGGGGAAGG